MFTQSPADRPDAHETADTAQNGVSPVSPQPHRLTVNQPFAEMLGSDGLNDYVCTIAQVAESSRGRRQDDVQRELSERLQRHGIELSDTAIERLAEQLVDPARGDLVIRLNSGDILFGAATEAAAAAEPVSSAGTADPQDPDRPLYS